MASVGPAAWLPNFVLIGFALFEFSAHAPKHVMELD
jgi:hypothetical protein